jgi:hypothetical protein
MRRHAILLGEGADALERRLIAEALGSERNLVESAQTVLVAGRRKHERAAGFGNRCRGLGMATGNPRPMTEMRRARLRGPMLPASPILMGAGGVRVPETENEALRSQSRSERDGALGLSPRSA